MKTKPKSKQIPLSAIPDELLAGMVRDGCYTSGEGIAKDSWVLVLAVPYGPVDGVDSLAEAFEAFRELMSAGDWGERNIQVLMLGKDGKPEVTETSYEDFTCTEDDCDCADRSWYGDEHDSACPLAGKERKGGE